MAFTRTPTGLAEKWRFHQVPTIWVEGPTDIFFYEPLTDGMSCRMEAFHGVENAEALIQGLVVNDYPYLIILDGDYTILKRSRSPHRHVIRLPRYSFENFFWERDAVNRACLRHARCGENKDLVGAEMERVAAHLETELLNLVTLDVAAQRSPSPPAVLPDHIEQLLVDPTQADVECARVAAIVTSVEGQLDSETVKTSLADINTFLRSGCFMHLLKGHLVLGVLSRVFVCAAAKESGVRSLLSNDAITQILAEMIWRQCRSDDHRRLKRMIRTKTKALINRY